MLYNIHGAAFYRHFRYIASFVDYRANCGIKLISHRLDNRTGHSTTGPITVTASLTAIGRLTTRSIAASPETAVVLSIEPIIAWLSATGPQSATMRCYRQHIAATIATGKIAVTIATGNASPPPLPATSPSPLPATHRRHRYRRHRPHRYRQRIAATATGDIALTATGNASPPPLPATSPSPLPATHRRHRYRRHRHHRYRKRIAATATGNASPTPLPETHRRYRNTSSFAASYVLSVSSLFLCGPLRRISVNARLYVQCCLVL